MSFDPRERKLCPDCDKYIDNRNWSRHVSKHNNPPTKPRSSRSLSVSDRTASVVGSEGVPEMSSVESCRPLRLENLLVAEKAAADLIQHHSTYDMPSLTNFISVNFPQIPESARPYLIIGAVAGAKHVAHVHYMAEAYKSSSGEHVETSRKIQRAIASWSMGLRDTPSCVCRPSCSSPSTSTVPLIEQTPPGNIPPHHPFLVELGLALDSDSIVLNTDMEDAYEESLGQPPRVSRLLLNQPPLITRQTPTSAPDITSSQPSQTNCLTTPTQASTMALQSSTPVTMINQSVSTTQNYPVNQQLITQIIPVQSQLSTQTNSVTPLMTTTQTHSVDPQIATQLYRMTYTTTPSTNPQSQLPTQLVQNSQPNQHPLIHTLPTMSSTNLPQTTTSTVTYPTSTVSATTPTILSAIRPLTSPEQHRHQPSRRDSIPYYERYRPNRRRNRSPSYDNDQRARPHATRYPNRY